MSEVDVINNKDVDVLKSWVSVTLEGKLNKLLSAGEQVLGTATDHTPSTGTEWMAHDPRTFNSYGNPKSSKSHTMSSDWLQTTYGNATPAGTTFNDQLQDLQNLQAPFSPRAPVFSKQVAFLPPPKSKFEMTSGIPGPVSYIDNDWYIRQCMSFDGLWKQNKQNVAKAREKVYNWISNYSAKTHIDTYNGPVHWLPWEDQEIYHII